MKWPTSPSKPLTSSAMRLAAPVSEVIVELPIKEGERVEADQVVVQLDTEVGEAELRDRKSVV